MIGKFAFNQRHINILIILLICLFSLFLKLKDIHNFYDKDNILSTPDAFRYARHAYEIQNYSYHRIDFLANVPDYGINQHPPPLLSLLAIWLSGISGIGMHHFFVFIPPILSLLFVIPFYLWLKPLSNDYITFGGITLCLFNTIYYTRTRAGDFDTDCLIIFFVFMMILFITRASAEKDDQFKSYLFIILSGITMAIFRWWYDHLFFAFFFIASLFIGLVVWRHGFKDIVLKTLLFTTLISPVELLDYIISSPVVKSYFFGAVFGLEEFKTPLNFFAFVAELQPVNFDSFVRYTTDNIATAIIGTAFLGILFIRNHKYLIIALPIIAIGFSAFFYGNRYLIYASPFLGMGLGYFIYMLFELIKKRFSLPHKAVYAVGLLLVIFLTFPAQRLYFESKPLFEKRWVDNFLKIKGLTEQNAYIWTWWDFGNTIQYYSQRPLFIDNTHFHPYKSYAIVKSLTESNEEFLRKSTAFFTNKLTDEYNETAKNLPLLIEKIKDYSERPAKPLYILVYEGIFPVSILKDNILPEEESKSLNRRININRLPCEIKKDITADCQNLIYDFKDDSLSINDANINVGYKKISYYNKQSNTKKDFHLNKEAQRIMYLVLAKDGRLYQSAAHEDFEQTMLFKMTIASENNFKHFELVYEDYPYMVLYRVK